MALLASIRDEIFRVATFLASSCFDTIDFYCSGEWSRGTFSETADRAEEYSWRRNWEAY